MTPEILTPLLDLLDLVGVAIFAMTGALVAAREKQTLVTLSFFALLTGVGGGTIRDLLIGAPVFWIHDTWVAAICLGIALFAWFTPTRWWDGSVLQVADGLGLAAYAVLGTAKALEYGLPPVPALLMGVITGCAGGIIRDVIAGRPSILMKPELYVTAAALAAGVTVLGDVANLPRVVVWTAATGAGFGLRLAAIRWKLALPAYQRD
jgi:uncharacterized membrane protein YeiH